MPRDYIALSFITLLCCCFPIGIFALLQSIKVCTLYFLDVRYYDDLILLYLSRKQNKTVSGETFFSYNLLSLFQARAASRDGNFGAAEQASYSARVLNIIGIILGTVIIIVLVIVVAILIDNGDCRKTGSRSYECF